MHAVVAPLLVVLRGQLVKQGMRNGMGTGKEMGLEWDRSRQDSSWLVEILFTNVAMDDSGLTMILFMN